MAFKSRSTISSSAFARYRAGLALDRMCKASNHVEQRIAARWALAWSRLAMGRVPEVKILKNQAE